MHIRFSFYFIVAFLLLVLLLHELHEWAHQLAGRFMCGCWPIRDFLYWNLCPACNNNTHLVWVGASGPFFTYFFMWLGVYLINKQKTWLTSGWGTVFILATLPLSRLMAIAFKGGDEIMAFRNWFAGHEPFKGAAVVCGGAVVLLLTIPPVWLAYKTIKNRPRLLFFSLLLVLPLLMDKLIIEGLLMPLLKKGFLAHPGFAGAPLLVNSWGIFLIASFVWMHKKISNSFYG
jgi:hypothetical protein